MLAVVVADGEPSAEDASRLGTADLVVAADGGARWLESTGRLPDLVVGDMDSLEPAAEQRLEAGGSRIVRHAVEKNASDTELALVEALAAGADSVVLVGALRGQRIDHELANVLLLTDPRFASRNIRIAQGRRTVRALSGGGRLVIDSPVGATVTLLAVGGDAIGITTRGLRYPLKGETLRMGSSRGLSNEVVERRASVRLEIGSLLVVEVGNEKGSSHEPD
jgi:thiamine pyrophosphokinase